MRTANASIDRATFAVRGCAAALILAAMFVGWPVAAQDAPPAQDADAITADEPIFEDLPPEFYPPDEYSLGRVIEVVERGEREFAGVARPYQVSRVRIENGPDRGREFETEHAGVYTVVGEGDKVVVVKVDVGGDVAYYIADEYRLGPLAFIFAAFFALAVFFGRLKGLTSILGMLFSIAVLALFVVPRIAGGSDPLTVTLIGSFAIAVVSLLVAHGLNRRTYVALGATLLTLGAAALLAALFVAFARLMGLGSEEAAYLQLTPLETVSLKGLLLGGIVIGTLGVLDDITTTQAATVEEISRANPALGVRELYRRGISVGREHIASLVNTLVLAYAGASLPLFLLFSINTVQPWWVVLNGEAIAEEVVRTIVGSSALILAVPLSTAIAAKVFGGRPPRPEEPAAHAHHSHA